MDLATELGAALTTDDDDPMVPVGGLDELADHLDRTIARIDTGEWSICPCGEDHDQDDDVDTGAARTMRHDATLARNLRRKVFWSFGGVTDAFCLSYSGRCWSHHGASKRGWDRPRSGVGQRRIARTSTSAFIARKRRADWRRETWAKAKRESTVISFPSLELVTRSC